MKLRKQHLHRHIAILAAFVLTMGSVLPTLLMVTASAAAQFPNRQIQVSDSAASGGPLTSGVGSGTAVQYKITIEPKATTNIGGLVIDICGNNPIVGDTTCTSPSGFSWGASPTVTISSGLTNANWTASSLAGDSITGFPVLKLKHATSEATSGNVVITVTGVTNPDIANQASATHFSYYARIMTFSTAADLDAVYTVTDSVRSTMATLETNNLVDYGGVALSTTTPISITAKVMETMSLCTSAADLSSMNCGGATDPAISIGEDSNGTKVLKETVTSTTPAYSQISTNAANGYDIYIRGRNSCGGLSKDGGTVCEIPAVATGDAVGNLLPAGTAAFGVKISDGAAVGTGTGSNLAIDRWSGTRNSGNYLMDTSSSNDNINYVYGSRVISSAAQANSVKNTYTFAATVSPTTPAGIYQQTFSLIAAGRF